MAKLDASKRPSNSSGRRAELICERRRVSEDLAISRASAGRASSSRKKFTPLDRRSTMSLEPIERVVGVGACRDRPQQRREHRLEGLLRGGERSDRALPERQLATCRAASFVVAKSERLQLLVEYVRIVRQPRTFVRRKAVEDRGGALHMRPQLPEQLSPSARP